MKFSAHTATRFNASLFLKRILLVMKLTTFLLIIALVQTSAKGFSQITLRAKNVPLEQVLKSIRQQTGYTFIYETDALQRRSVSVDVNNASLATTLLDCFKDQPLTYQLVGKNVVIQTKENTLAGKIKDLFTPADIYVSGQVLDENGKPLQGATIKLKDSLHSTTITTSTEGRFGLRIPGTSAILVISYVGYQTKEVTVSGADVNLVIRLEPGITKLNDAVIVSTGYQTLPLERATGSFEQVDNKLLNLSTTPTILDRLEGITSGIMFDKREQGAPQLQDMSIRGVSTLTNTISSPLVVLDNFPYEGDVNNINPDDVESITILKDAAAASIWGAKAGNGVIVITTKKGKYNKPLQISFNTNAAIADKPDLFYFKQMGTSDYINLETTLFNDGKYTSTINSPYHPLISPVVELLADAKSGAITQSSATDQINALRGYDVRNDYLKYFYRKDFLQQYSLNLDGGTQDFNYIVSGGYDKDLKNLVTYSTDRMNLRADLFFRPVKNLEIETGMIYTQSGTNNIGSSSNSEIMYNSTVAPYTQFADAAGNPLVVGKDYRLTFAENPGDPRLLNWTYNPLAELHASTNIVTNTDMLLNLGARYKINSIFSADIKFQSDKLTGATRDWEGLGSYYTRNLINNFTQPVGSAVIQPVPVGDIINNAYVNSAVYDYRAQLNADKTWGNNQFSAIAGAEVNQRHITSNSYSIYGYNDNLLTSQNVNFNQIYTPYINNFANPDLIPSGIFLSDQIYRFTSYFANASYTYAGRYTVSASARKDASNLFGVNTNQRGVPLWSGGISWNVDKEPFYNFNLLPLLKLRATYGYQGNLNNGLTAFSVIKSSPGVSSVNLPNDYIVNPANDNLRWEKIGTTNLGIDFGFKNNIVTGSLEYYKKHSTDVISVAPIDPTTGFTSTSLNNAEIKGQGVDLLLHSNNLPGAFKWRTDFIFSYNNNDVTKYTPSSTPTGPSVITSGYAITPIQGKPTETIFSYKWAGLDPTNGAPRGYLNGVVSENYSSLDNAAIKDLQYNGSAVPIYFGSFRNSFAYKRIELSVNIRYELDYYFRRQSMNYTSFVNSGIGNADYADRWQKPGDELHTDVPSFIYPINANRETFYANSAALVSRGDNARLENIVLSYTPVKFGHYFKSIRFYANAANLPIIWRANKYGIDPDYGTGYPAPQTITVGLNATF
jgi:TonB-linked SusC/RagA family outer membrane protein